MLLGMLFECGTYNKLYSYRHLINGFAIHLSPEQAETLRHALGVKSVERDSKVKRLTTHTAQFFGLPTGCGQQEVAIRGLEKTLSLDLWTLGSTLTIQFLLLIILNHRV